MSSWYLRVLGRPELWWEEQEIGLRLSGRLWAILTYLALEGAPVTRETLALKFWSASAVNDPRGNLRVALATLKKRLPKGMLSDTEAGIALVQGGASDLQQLRKRVAQAEVSEEPGIKCRLLKEASLPMRGFFLEGRSDLGVWGDWVYNEVFEEQVMLLEQLLVLQREQADSKGAVMTARLLKYLSPEHSQAKRCSSHRRGSRRFRSG